MTTEYRTYRNRNTGLLQRLHPRVAAVDPNLSLVDEDAKPLAYTPIPEEVVKDYLDSKTTEDEE